MRQYNILFEAEVIPLFIGGVCTVGLIALVLGGMLLRHHRRSLCLFVGHMISLAAAMVFLIRCLFAGRLGISLPDFAASTFNSVNLGLFGVFWTVSVGFLLLMIGSLKNSSGTSQKNRRNDD